MSTPRVFLEFNVDGAARGKLEPTSVGDVDHKVDVLLMFSKNVSIKESNETKVLANLEALHLFFPSFCDRLLVEGDSSIVISWISSNEGPWSLHLIFA